MEGVECVQRVVHGISGGLAHAPGEWFQVGYGSYLPGWTGIKSLIVRPNTHIAGDSFVSGEGGGVFRYWSMAIWNRSVFKEPF